CGGSVAGVLQVRGDPAGVVCGDGVDQSLLESVGDVLALDLLAQDGQHEHPPIQTSLQQWRGSGHDFLECQRRGFATCSAYRSDGGPTTSYPAGRIGPPSQSGRGAECACDHKLLLNPFLVPPSFAMISGQ